MIMDRDHAKNAHHDAGAPVVACEKLSKVYKRLLAKQSQAVCALQQVSLSVHPGQIVGLIGPNGAGKSTLLNLIAGLIFPSAGQVTVCGHPARSIEAHRSLGYMPEHPVFLGGYSARATLRYHGALLRMSRETVVREVDRSVQQLQLQDFIDRPCAEFSQGMKQRLALAVALLGNPKLLLLDEPSNGLDPVGIIHLRDLLTRLRDEGCAIMVSSHRLGELEKLTSDYVYLQHGRIVTLGEAAATDAGTRLHIALESGGGHIAETLLSEYQVFTVDETGLDIAVQATHEIPDIVNLLSQGGARIIGVWLQKQDVEDAFLRLYQETQGKP